MGSHKTLFLWGYLLALLSHNLLLLPLAAASNCGVDNHSNSLDPKGLSASLCHHHSHGGKNPPSHGGGGGGCGCSPSTPPSHGGGGHHHDPYTPTPSSPPYTPTPSLPPYTPSPIVPSPPYTPTPSLPPYTPTPSSPPYTPTPSSPPGCTPTTPSSPPSGGGGYYGSPPPIVDIPPPTPTITPVTPITPITPISPAPPVPIDPGSGGGPFPCSYWGSHPGLIYGVLGWFGTVGGIFGVGSLPGLGGLDPSSVSLQKVLSNPQPASGYGSLYREATASFLNSLEAPKKFPFTTSYVREAFASALVSDKAAASQARLFRLANEGRLKLV